MSIKQFVITDFGAISGTEAPQTEAIQKALEPIYNGENI